MTGKLSVISAALAALTVAVAGIYWFTAGGTLAVAADLLVRAAGVLWILGIGFTAASGIAILAISRGESPRLPFIVIGAEILGFLFMILAIALS